jgi:hypothetical protein
MHQALKQAASVVVGLGISSAAFAADSDMAARKLFYQDNQPEVVFKAVAVAVKAQNLVPTAQYTGTTQTKKQAAQSNGTAVRPVKPAPLPPNSDMLAAKAKEALAQAVAAYTPDGTPVRKAANLGVRYNVMKVNPVTGDMAAVPADTNFKKGECVSIRMSPNRGGFMYVFNQATSGKWQPLIPSEDLPEEPSAVRPYQVITVPSQNCFEMDDPPGEERLFIMITEKPEDIKNLDDMLKMLGKPAQPGTPAGAPQRADAVAVAMNKLSDTIQGLQTQLASRDIKITKVAQPMSKMELPNTVYYTNAAATTNDRLIMEIKLKHN